MRSFATTAITRPARAQIAWMALSCAVIVAASGGCRRELEGLRPDERPQLVPPPPGFRPVDPAPTPAPVATGGVGGTQDGGDGSGVGGGGVGDSGVGGSGLGGAGSGGATDGAPTLVDAVSDPAPPSRTDAQGRDAGGTAPTPQPPPRPDAPTVRDTGQAEALPGSGVVVYLPLDEGVGASVAEDVSGNQNRASLRGLDVRGAWVDGRFGSALRFPGGGAASGGSNRR